MRQKPPGKALAWSDAALERLSEVTEADLDAAVALWRNTAPLKALLDAQVVEEGDVTTQERQK